jgi:gamma-glutamyltranspeptidase/glutathione hydrolase
MSLSKRFGRLPFADLFEPAIRYARDGFLVSPTIAAIWGNQPRAEPR